MLHTLFISVSPEHSPGFSVFHRPESGNPKTIRPIRLRRPERKRFSQLIINRIYVTPYLPEEPERPVEKPVENSVEKLMAQPFSTPGGQLRTNRLRALHSGLATLPSCRNTTKKGQHTRAIPPKILLGRNASAGKLHPHHHAAITAQQLVHRLERSCI